MIRHIFGAAVALSFSVPLAAGDVTRGRVINGIQWYVDGAGSCFRIAADGDVQYDRSVRCAAPSESIFPAGEIVGGIAGKVINGRQYYKDTQGRCYYVDQYGEPRYDRDAAC